MAILKLKNHDENKEIQFEIEQLKKMTVEERFRMMFEKSKIIQDLLNKHGHSEPVKIVKRP